MVLLGPIYFFAGVSIRLRRALRPCEATSTVVVVGTFHNPGWVRAHLIPLALSDAITKVIVVSDTVLVHHERLEYRVPQGIDRYLGRTLAKLRLTWLACRDPNVGLVMGYHLVPNSIIAMICSSRFKLRCAYQMTGGPIQLQGGGFGSPNSVQGLLIKPMPVLERLALWMTKKFDVIVVRGESAANYVQRHTQRTSIIVTGGVAAQTLPPVDRDIDAICVSRLEPRKGVDLAIKLCAEVNKLGRGRSMSLYILGEGSARDELEALAKELAVPVRFVGQVDDVMPFLNRSKLFLLLSESEGVSIAMLEAMFQGVVPVVSNVGDLKDFVVHEHTGLLVEANDMTSNSMLIQNLLSTEQHLRKLSKHAHSTVAKRTTIPAVAEKWTSLIQKWHELD